MDEIDLALPDDNSWSQTYQVMANSPVSYEISRWTKESIESHPLGTATGCRNTSLNFNFKTKEFYFMTRNAGGDCKLPLGGKIEKLSKPRISQIVDGKKIFDQKFDELAKVAYETLASDFRKRVESLAKQERQRKP
jgi:hypothetical protein